MLGVDPGVELRLKLLKGWNLRLLLLDDSTCRLISFNR